MRLVNWRSLAIGVAGFGLAACGDDVAVVQPVTLTPSQTAISCNTGSTIAIGASLNPAQSNATFTYTGTATPANAFTVTGSGATATLVCSNAGTGSITITAGGQTVTVPVTVTQSASQYSIIIAPSNASVAVGGTVTVSGTVIGTGTLPAVRYRSAQPTIATVDSVSGVVRGVAAGVATIIASPAGFPGTAAAATVTVLGSGGLVSSIVANPASVELQTGQTQQISATVNLQTNAPTNTARTVTYTSQNTAVATVSSTGLVTGVANGSTSIIVRSTADTAIFVAVPVTVRAQAPVRLSISSVTTQNSNLLVDITQPIGTNPNNPGNNSNAGSIFVTLSLDPGDAAVSRVDLFLAPAATPNDTTNRVCSQVFSSQLADAYRLAMQNGSADVQPIVCPINLAAFDTATGRPGILNGSSVLRARVTGTFPGTTGSATQIAQFTQTLTINNLSGFYVRATNTPDAAQAAVNARGTAQGPDGRNWVAGSVAFSVLPVSFDTTISGAPANRTITVTLTDPAAYGAPAPRTQTVTAAASGATTITFAGRTATRPVGVSTPAAGTAAGDVAPRSFGTSDQNIDGWSSGANGTTVAVSGVGFGGSAAFFTLASTLNGQSIPTSSGGNQNPAFFRLNIDNLAPQPATQFNVLQPNFTSISAPVAYVGFLGRNTTVNSTSASFANRLFAPTFDSTFAGPNLALGSRANGDFGGVDRVTTSFVAQLIANVSSVTTTNIFTGGTTFTTGSQLAAAPNNQAYAAVARFVDVLGNARNQLVQQGAIAQDAAGQINSNGVAVTFGVDLADPILTITNASSIDTIINAANQGVANNDIAVAFQDAIGFGSTPLTVLGQRIVRNPDAPSTSAPSTFCLDSISTGGTAFFHATAATSACSAVAVGNVSTLIIPKQNGQYTFDITTRDQAGNVSPTVRINEYIDVTLPGIGATSLPQVLSGNGAVTFVTAASDNMELGSAYPQVAYAANAAYGTGAFTLSYASQSITQLGRAFDNVFTAVNSGISLTIPSFLRSVTFTGAANAPGAVTNANLAQALIPVVTDAAIVPGFQANQASGVVAIPGVNIAQTGFGATVFATGNQTSQVNAFALGFANGSATFANQLSLGGTTNAPTSGTFTVSSSGQLGAFINPFARVELWYSQVGGAAVYQRLATVTTGLTTDNAAAAANLGRTITSTNTFTAIGTPLAAGVNSTTNVQYNVVAVGITAAGDALVSAPVTVTIIP